MELARMVQGTTEIRSPARHHRVWQKFTDIPEHSKSPFHSGEPRLRPRAWDFRSRLLSTKLLKPRIPSPSSSNNFGWRHLRNTAKILTNSVNFSLLQEHILIKIFNLKSQNTSTKSTAFFNCILAISLPPLSLIGLLAPGGPGHCLVHLWVFQF